MYIIKPRVKFVTFDRNVIRRNWKAINYGPMQRAGNLVRIIARRSIKRRGRSSPPSRPGSPPFSRQFGKSPPFKQIYSVPNSSGSSVVVGMVGYGNNAVPVPGLHELGLTTRSRRLVRRFTPVRRGHRITNPGALSSRARQRIALWRAANFLQRSVTTKYPLRPFMRPALAQAIPQLPAMWSTSISS